MANANDKSVGPFKNLRHWARGALVLSAGLSASPASAHEAAYEVDLMYNTAQCAAYNLAEYAVLSARESEVDQHGQAQGLTFRQIAIELADGDTAKVDYMISAEMLYFARLHSDALGVNGNAVSHEVLDRQAQFCQNVGMHFGPERGFH